VRRLGWVAIAPAAERAPQSAGRHKHSFALLVSKCVAVVRGGTRHAASMALIPMELPDPGHGGPVEQHLDRRLSVAFDKQTVRLFEPRRPMPPVTIGSDERDQALVDQPPEDLFGDGPVATECRVAVRARRQPRSTSASAIPKSACSPIERSGWAITGASSTVNRRSAASSTSELSSCKSSQDPGELEGRAGGA
jgi:hypothetical protein